MNRNVHQIDNLYKEAIEQWQEAPGLSAWKQIEKKLDEQSILRATPKGATFRKIVIIAILLLAYLRTQDVESSTYMENQGFYEHPFTPAVTDLSNEQQKTSRLNSEQLKGSLLIAQQSTSQLQAAELESGLLTPTNNFLKHLEEHSIIDPRERKLALTPLIIVPSSAQPSEIRNTSPALNNRDKTSQFSVTARLTQGLSFYHLKGNQTHAATREEIKNTEEQELSTIAGLLVNYELDDRWTLQNGINFSNTIILIDPKTIYAEDVEGIVKYRYNTSSGYAHVLPSFAAAPTIGDSLYTMEASHTLQYLGIPIATRYYFKKGKINFYAAAGITVDILLKGEIETSIENGVDREIEIIRKLNGLKKIYLSGSVEVGLQHQLNKKFCFELAPAARFSLNSINKNTPIKSYPFSVGINTGITYRF